MTCGINVQHEAGYICSMLFIIPGFPFITSGIDMAKLDMRSGLERLSYAVMIVLIATMAAWLMALALHLKPVDFLPLNLSMLQYIVFRLLTSFCGVFGFSAHRDYSAVYCDYGARPVSLPRNLQSRYDEPEHFRFVVRICHIDHSRASARTDLRPHYDG